MSLSPSPTVGEWIDHATSGPAMASNSPLILAGTAGGGMRRRQATEVKNANGGK